MDRGFEGCTAMAAPHWTIGNGAGGVAIEDTAAAGEDTVMQFDSTSFPAFAGKGRGDVGANPLGGKVGDAAVADVGAVNKESERK